MSRHRWTTASLLAALVGCSDAEKPFEPAAAEPAHEGPHFTVGSGSASTLLGRTTFSPADDQPFKVKRMEGDWHVEIKALRGLDLAVQRIVFQPGAQSGWHRHPGPVFIQVVSGSIAFYESDDPTCTPIIRTAGQGFLDTGDHAHLARNETGEPAENIVTYFAPPATPLRIDAPLPGNCPF
ncbi:MAG TPA: cupin domain-containing protein [Gemmatimonadales bacterium]|nr:cupin domain-containing protein [Gemmatimonadales bacterium]